MKKYLSVLIEIIKKYYIAIILFVLYISITYILKIPNCLIKILFGIPCPGCGMTRAGFAILKFNFIEAFNFNPLIYVFPFILFILFFQSIPTIKKIYNSKVFWITISILIITSYVLRLIYVYPNPPMDYNENSLINILINFIKNILK